VILAMTETIVLGPIPEWISLIHSSRRSLHWSRSAIGRILLNQQGTDLTQMNKCRAFLRTFVPPTLYGARISIKGVIFDMT
jgi:hypothetical protein